MMRMVNLARRPFVNSRPVRRTAVLLWVIGCVLLITNVWLYRDFWKSSAEIRGQLTALDTKIRQEQGTLKELDGRLVALDLDEQNLKVLYLNRLIAYRTFPWSALFDQLVEVLPSEVRLATARPEVHLGDDARLVAQRRSASANRRSSRSRRSPQRPATSTASFEDEVALQLTGVAKNDEELLKFIDALYEDPAFRQPVLISEQRDPSTQMISFTLTAVYRIRQEDGASGDLAALLEDDPQEGVAEVADGSTREERLVDEDLELDDLEEGQPGEPVNDDARAALARSVRDAAGREAEEEPDEVDSTRSAVRPSAELPRASARDVATSRRPAPPPTSVRRTPPPIAVPVQPSPRATPPRSTTPRRPQNPRRQRGLTQPLTVRPSASSAQRLHGLRPFAESWWPSAQPAESTEVSS